MAEVILNNDNHLAIKVDTRATKEFGDHVNRAIALSSEIAELHKEFPILLYRNPETSELVGHAILGLDKDENLFIENDQWITQSIPASHARGPFSIGYQRAKDGENIVDQPVILIDEKSPRIGNQGHAIFLEMGGDTPYLEGIRRVLQIIDAGFKADRSVYPMLQNMGLLEEVAIKVSLNADEHYEFKNYVTVSDAKLRSLNGEQLIELNKSGALAVVFFLLSSLGNFQRLISLKNAKNQS